MAPIELTATAFGLASVWFYVRENILAWPTGLVMVFLYIFIFWDAKLYSDAGLQIIYVVIQIYGWWAWLHGGAEKGELAMSRLTNGELAAWVGAALIDTAAWGTFMASQTDAAAPYRDAFIVVASLVAQWLPCRKKLQSWYFWIAVDIVAVGTFYERGLVLTSGLYAVFLVLATLGLVEWRRTLRTRTAAAPA